MLCGMAQKISIKKKSEWNCFLCTKPLWCLQLPCQLPHNCLCCHPHFSGNETEGQRGQAAFLKLPGRKGCTVPRQLMLIIHAMLYPPITIFSSQNLSPQSVPESLVTFWPTLALGLWGSGALGLWACPSHLLTTNEVFGYLRLGPQRPLKLTLWEELASFHPGLPGVADRAGAFEGGARPTQE